MEDSILKFEDEFASLIAKIIKNNLGDELAKIPHDKPAFVNKKERGQEKIFFMYMDLKATYDSIKNYLVYIDSFPFSPEVSKVSYLKFIYTAYLNEIYMLQERIKALTPVIERSLESCRNDSEFIEDCEELKKITDSVKKYFDSIKKIRGEHVHENRYDTEELNKVAMCEFVLTDTKENFDIPNLDAHLHNLIINQQLKYKGIMEKQIVNITKIFNFYTEAIRKFLFEKEYIDKVVYKKSGRR